MYCDPTERNFLHFKAKQLSLNSYNNAQFGTKGVTLPYFTRNF